MSNQLSPLMRLLYRLGEIQDNRRWAKKQKEATNKEPQP